MMRIVVTGCTGFVGEAVCKELIGRGHKIIGVARNNPVNLDEIIATNNFSFYKVDIACPESLKTIFASNQIDCVIHLAAYIPGKECDYQQCISTNYVGFFNLLELIRTYNIPNLVFASSQMVYSQNVDSPIAEDALLEPSTIYGLSKKQGEELSEHYALNHNINTIILRFSGIYGEQKEAGVVHNFIKHALKNQDLTIDQKNKTKDIVYIKDAVKLIINSLENVNDTPFVIVNAGGVSISLYHLAKKIIDLTSSNSNLVLRGDDTLKNFQLSMSRAENIFGHHPIRLDDALVEMIDLTRQT